MQIFHKKLIPKSLILKAVLIFFLGLIASVVIWVQVKDTYFYMITLVASKLLAWIKDASLEGIAQRGDAFSVTMGFMRGNTYASAVVSLSSSVSRYYTFTVPLTFALLASLSLFIKKRKRAFAEAVLLLFLSHLLYVFFVEGTTLTEQLMLNGIEPVSAGWLSFYQYLWKAMEFTVMSFGPFFIAAYVFVRFKK